MASKLSILLIKQYVLLQIICQIINEEYLECLHSFSRQFDFMAPSIFCGFTYILQYIIVLVTVRTEEWWINGEELK